MKHLFRRVRLILWASVVLFSLFLSHDSAWADTEIAGGDDFAGMDLIATLDTEALDQILFESLMEVLPSYYLQAFKAIVPVTCFMNTANMDDTRLLYKNWGSILGVAATANQVVMSQPYQSHRGQDWNSSVPQEPLYAVHDGVITRASYDSSYGNRVDYTFGNWTLYMGHMSEIDVNVGDVVTKGQKLGNVGSTGNVTGEHTHFGLLYNGQLVDPHPFLIGVWDFDAKQAELEGTLLPDGTEVYVDGPGIYINNYSLSVRIRSGPGTDNAIEGLLAPGTQVEITNVIVEDGFLWGKHSAGYSCIQEGELRYLTREYFAGIYENITGQDIILRSSPGTTYEMRASIAHGSAVEYTSFSIVNGNEIWARHADGWTCVELYGVVHVKRNE